MRLQVLKLLTLPLVLLGIVILGAISRPAEAAPPDVPGSTIGHIAQEAGVTLEKQASAELVQLGQEISYTITIRNDGAETINATLTDTLPDLVEGLALQTDTISATVGTAEDGKNNNLVWTGRLASDEEAIISYQAIPPSTSTAGQTLVNVAVLKFGGTTLQASATITTQAPDLGIWGSFVNYLAQGLVVLDQSLQGVHIPFSFGFAIILFTVVVRLATFPLNMQQIKSSKAMQELQPQLKELQEKHKGDREKLAQEQMRLYKEAGVNPLGGCLPMIVQMPIWFALYRSLIQLSSEGLLDEGFFWIPSLAGPVSDWGGGISWLWPFVDGAPPLGWADTLAYLVLPILLVVSQLYMQKLMSPPSSDPQQAQMQSIMKFMPLMFGYFALVVPSGLSLYWFTSNILGVAQHYFTKTQVSETPAPAKKSVSAPANSPVPANPVPANPVPANPAPDSSGEGHKTSKKDKNVRRRSKRKSKRKR